jgi:hypothetical protein
MADGKNADVDDGGLKMNNNNLSLLTVRKQVSEGRAAESAGSAEQPTSH